MARAHFVKSARKKNPVAEIGESYYWWKFIHGGKLYSKTKPRLSQLTNSDKLSRAYSLSERLADIERCSPECVEELGSVIDDAKVSLEDVWQEVTDLAEEYRESASNIRDAISESPTADECDEKADNLDSWVDTIKDAIQELESIDLDSASDDLEAAISGFHNALDSANECPL